MTQHSPSPDQQPGDATGSGDPAEGAAAEGAAADSASADSASADGAVTGRGSLRRHRRRQLTAL
ncbi:hypothetical protein, partial [Actinomyces radicidentis]|uniref:hypothetical protein n=1 Tax=Actinomyces radicidentis TaxID=111015 RepID=UPI0026DF02A2